MMSRSGGGSLGRYLRLHDTPPPHSFPPKFGNLAEKAQFEKNMDAHIAEWKTRAEALKPLNLKQIEPQLAELDAHLTLRSHIVGYTLTDADTTVWQTLRGNRVAHAYVKQDLMRNLGRWFRYIEAAYPQQTVVVQEGKTKGKDGKEGKKGGKDDGGANYEIGLQDVEDPTSIVTRFPPEPSGYLHIGHAKVSIPVPS